MRAGREVVIGLALIGAVATAAPAWVAAADPTQPPPGTCGDRYPADGPAGVDLQLGCMAAELVAHYTGRSAPVEATPLSGYVPQLTLIAVGIAGLIVASLVARRRLGRRLAPVMPDEWWSCAACHSVNAVTIGSCYRCGALRSPDAVTMQTVANPETPQAFGHDWRDD